MIEPILSFNKTTGCYEGTVRVQVDAEIFRRLLLKAIEEDEASDLTDPHTWMDAIARVGKVESWIGKPHTKVTPVSTTPVVVAQVRPVETLVRPKTQVQLLEERLREQVRRVAPHLWDTVCLTPYGDASQSAKERKAIGKVRHNERQVLKQLREEWQHGDLTLEPEAAQAERLHQELQQMELSSKLEVVASAVNGNRFH